MDPSLNYLEDFYMPKTPKIDELSKNGELGRVLSSMAQRQKAQKFVAQ